LPAEKLAQLAEITRDYSDLIAQTRQRTLGSPIMPWDREQLAYIEQEQRADIEALFTPEELELYELYSSPTANNLRRRLSQFSPSEEEFRALYDLQKVFDEAYDLARGPRDADRMRAAAQAQQELNEQFKAVLGEERYTQLQRSMDRSYVAATSIVEHFKLPAKNAVAVYDLTQEMVQRGQELRVDRSLPEDQRNSRLAELGAEGTERLNTLLTPDGAKAYRESGAGSRWLNLISPPTRSPVRP